MDLLPAIDLRNGKVVRLEQGDDRRRTDYGDDPRAVAERHAEAGALWLHLVDLDAAFGEQPQRALVEALLAALAEEATEAAAGEVTVKNVAVELGGGLRDRAAVEWALGAGCARAVIGSLAVRDAATFAELAGDHPGRLVPAAEVADGKLRVAGWREASPVSLHEYCRQLRDLPCPAVLVTDVERDGTLAGPNLDLARRVTGESGIPSLLSGGVRSLDDLAAAARVREISGAIVGKALYDGVFSLEAALRAASGEPPSAEETPEEGP